MVCCYVDSCVKRMLFSMRMIYNRYDNNNNNSTASYKNQQQKNIDENKRKKCLYDQEQLDCRFFFNILGKSFIYNNKEKPSSLLNIYGIHNRNKKKLAYAKQCVCVLLLLLLCNVLRIHYFSSNKMLCILDGDGEFYRRLINLY